MIKLLQAFALAAAGFGGIEVSHDELQIGTRGKDQPTKIINDVNYYTSFSIYKASPPAITVTPKSK
jgi:hypothetical protein